MAHYLRYMTHEPTALAIKIGKYIQLSRGCAYADIKSRAAERSIPPDVLEEALRVLHRLPQIHRTVAGGDVQYVWKEVVAKPVTVASHVTWVNEHYPWPEEFVMPFPEIDMSWMFLRTLEERQAYKSAAAGRYVAGQWYERERD